MWRRYLQKVSCRETVWCDDLDFITTVLSTDLKVSSSLWPSLSHSHDQNCVDVIEMNGYVHYVVIQFKFVAKQKIVHFPKFLDILEDIFVYF